MLTSVVQAFKSLPAFPVAFLLIGAAGVGYTASDMPLDRFAAMLPGSGCDIKGNVSVDTGERIYHVPGQPYYHDTVISMDKGERWFCSEAEARQAGWRKARNGSSGSSGPGARIILVQ
ncbi:succinoglycan biosynthesis protein exoi [Mesorhizobium sp. YIM 152430]|uniref:sunset domain-containing protein n=1 Tax=Mesorhizobium sp. YIM 152430 TaxID=3031761 RepID=UPI0023DC4B84|nr:succinoglycan biosynthesis protein exoi [Mesorhizobium sp. YIM 152430]MDF1598242.1 succinoglycan biosynthesis protein exoi [Mesorhizobium sp. YIM 152430]